MTSEISRECAFIITHGLRVRAERQRPGSSAAWPPRARARRRSVPPCITAMRSLIPRISGSSEEIMMIAMPCSARSTMRRWISDFDPTSTPCVGSSRISTSGLIASQRASATFC